ncbi:MAG: alanyl-tRNA editing protein [Candidatus Marsarchaeota archaeon]|nr:alanyl-tRNA editing protein [Candidatus Marsarchaeota archaeon]
MTEYLYSTDSYMREFDAVITDLVPPNGVVLDKTAFYPGGGGQPNDQGWLSLSGGKRFTVTAVRKADDGRIVHLIDGENPALGERVHGIIDWNLRYSYMRHHSALHVVSGVAYNLYNAKITGSNIYSDRARMDLSSEQFDRSKVSHLQDEANKIVMEDHRITVRFIRREEAANNPSLARVDPSLYPQGDMLRVVEIEGFDAQFDGGTHVSSTTEIGRITISRFENKGRTNKRIEVVLS